MPFRGRWCKTSEPDTWIRKNPELWSDGDGVGGGDERAGTDVGSRLNEIASSVLLADRADSGFGLAPGVVGVSAVVGERKLHPVGR